MQSSMRASAWVRAWASVWASVWIRVAISISTSDMVGTGDATQVGECATIVHMTKRCWRARRTVYVRCASRIYLGVKRVPAGALEL